MEKHKAKTVKAETVQAEMEKHKAKTVKAETDQAGTGKASFSLL
ncbi:hypothetical protein [Shewanella sp. MBTL60-007]|nr:hypothetical protein [Shewanella sp. MBTL60-007]GIU28120.1 hypothetical protein TUM3792_36550 [Shewanella sp. MBTL60-007]